jgi:2-succinyl-5-enolpyruvyl-6-hydroxy-3-cyclohexene-1-carboxylate synthase
VTTSHQHTTYAYVSAFVDELARSGVRHACVCPGSRSTPLAMMLAEHAERNDTIRLWMHLDERSAAFFALGLAKALREPVVLLCTSGTAAANFMPAVAEAYLARIPLIVLTADRPPELRDVGAPQTIDQLHLYGSHVKWFAEIALPESTPDALRYIRAIANRAAAESMIAPAGPVHLNFPFREPLVPLPSDEPLPEIARPEHQPYTAVTSGLRRVDSETLQRLAANLRDTQHGLIVCGPQDDPEFPAAAAALSHSLGYPILADPLSQVRCGHHNLANIVSAYDAFLRDPDVVARLEPKVILRFGAVPTSKPLTQYLAKYAGARQILIDGGGGWRDPALIATEIIHADARLFCEDLTDQIEKTGVHRDHAWVAVWHDIEQHTQSAIAGQLSEFEDVFEGSVFGELATLLPDGATLFASSSMPVRDMDTFFPADGKTIRFLANRGANGIDGVVSSALGVSAACRETGSGPLVLVIGDIAFYHDMNGLLAAKLHGLNATIILVNNDGGGIFSFLPQADHPQHFEQLFGTPHDLDFRHAAALYGTSYTRVADWPAFRTAVAQGITSQGLNIVEVQTNRDRNVQQHRAIWKVVSTALKIATLAPNGMD